MDHKEKYTQNTRVSECSEYSPMIADVSRETMDKLHAYAAELKKWNQRINLVARCTDSEIWDRHILNCLSIVKHDHTPEQPWIDVGSGGGLPGLVLAIMRSEIVSSGPVTLVDKDQRKCAFLRQIAFKLDLNVTVKQTLLPSKRLPQFRYLSARALAPLDKLLYLTHQHLTHDGSAFFMKGAGLTQEIATAKHNWNFEYETFSSGTTGQSVIIRVQNISRRQPHEENRNNQPKRRRGKDDNHN